MYKGYTMEQIRNYIAMGILAFAGCFPALLAFAASFIKFYKTCMGEVTIDLVWLAEMELPIILAGINVWACMTGIERIEEDMKGA